jgi:kynurenine formamidase
MENLNSRRTDPAIKRNVIEALSREGAGNILQFMRGWDQKEKEEQEQAGEYLKSHREGRGR